MRKHKNLLIAITIFIVSFSIVAGFFYINEQNYQAEQRSIATTVGNERAYALERQLDRSLSSTFALASIIRQKGRITSFDALAADMIDSYGGISSLQLAPNAVVSQIYPLAGNEAAIGHDLLNDPNRRNETLATIESGELTLAGPFELIQGGIAVIGRYPVFLDEETGESNYWGFTIALIRLDGLLDASGFNSVKQSGYDYEIWRYSPNSEERHIFFQTATAPLPDPINIHINVPNGVWTLSIAPQGGWGLSRIFFIGIGLAFFSSLLMSVFVYRILQQPETLRKLAEETENKFKSITTQSSEGITVADVNGNYIFVNPAFCEMVGYSEKELLQMSVFYMRGKSQDSSVFEKSTTTDENVPITVVLQRKDGTEFTAEVTGKMIDFHGKQSVLGIIRDITERKLAEQKIKERTRYLTALNAISTEIIESKSLDEILEAVLRQIVISTKVDGAECHLIEEGSVLSLKMTYKLDEIFASESRKFRFPSGVGIPGRAFEHREPVYVANAPSDTRYLRSALAETAGYHSLLCIPILGHKANLGTFMLYSLEPREFSPEINEMLMTVGRQIATAIKRLQAEEALATQRKGLANIIQGTDAGTWDWNLKTGEVVFNQRWAEIIGHTLKELVPHNIQTWIDSVHPEDLPSANALLDKHFEGVLDYYDVECRQLHKNGDWIWVNARGKVVEWGKDGKPLRMSGTHLDINERKIAEQNILLLNKELEQRVLDRTAELSATIQEIESFSYSVSHDLRAPLRAISGFSEILMNDHTEALDSETNEYLNKIHDASQNMDDLITGMLFLSRLSRERLSLIPFNPDQIAKQVFESLIQTAGQREIIFNARPCPEVIADPKLIKILLNNLISNAIKFTKGEKFGMIEFGSMAEKDRTVFYLRDNGIGFNMAYADKIFMPFQRLHSSDQFAGTGIGLAIAHRVIQRHKGEIWIESEEGAGTSVYFTIGDL